MSCCTTTPNNAVSVLTSATVSYFLLPFLPDNLGRTGVQGHICFTMLYMASGCSYNDYCFQNLHHSFLLQQ